RDHRGQETRGDKLGGDRGAGVLRLRLFDAAYPVLGDRLGLATPRQSQGGDEAEDDPSARHGLSSKGRGREDYCHGYKPQWASQAKRLRPGKGAGRQALEAPPKAGCGQEPRDRKKSCDAALRIASSFFPQSTSIATAISDFVQIRPRPEA